MTLFFNDTATTEIYTLYLHDALPISRCTSWVTTGARLRCGRRSPRRSTPPGSRRSPRSAARTSTTWRSGSGTRSEEHTSELQSRQYLVCRLLLEKKKRVADQLFRNIF